LVKNFGLKTPPRIKEPPLIDGKKGQVPRLLKQKSNMNLGDDFYFLSAIRFGLIEPIRDQKNNIPN
jgi:hypothetical protein